MKKQVLCLAIGAALAMPAMAHNAGDIIVRGGVTTVAPDDDSGHVSVAGASTPYTASVDNDTQLGLNFVYMATDNIGVELLAATPFEHDIKLHNAGDLNGTLAETKHLPPTVTLQYYFDTPVKGLTPYAGVGINYTKFFDEDFKGTYSNAGFSDLSLDDSWGYALNVGVDYMFDDHWLINASVYYLDIDTDAHFDLAGDRGSVSVDVDPYVYSVMVGYRF